MKTLVAALLLLPSLSFATPYFRIIDVHHPEMSAGSVLDPVNIGQSQAVVVTSIIRHDAADGYLLIPGEDWSLLDLGWAGSGTGSELVLGPSWNIAPILAAAAPFLPSALDSAAKSVGDVSFGPQFVYDPLYRPAHGTTLGHGYLRLFLGAKWGGASGK